MPCMKGTTCLRRTGAAQQSKVASYVHLCKHDGLAGILQRLGRLLILRRQALAVAAPGRVELYAVGAGIQVDVTSISDIRAVPS